MPVWKKICGNLKTAQFWYHADVAKNIMNFLFYINLVDQKYYRKNWNNFYVIRNGRSKQSFIVTRSRPPFIYILQFLCSCQLYKNQYKYVALVSRTVSKNFGKPHINDSF